MKINFIQVKRISKMKFLIIIFLLMTCSLLKAHQDLIFLHQSKNIDLSLQVGFDGLEVTHSYIAHQYLVKLMKNSNIKRKVRIDFICDIYSDERFRSLSVSKGNIISNTEVFLKPDKEYDIYIRLTDKSIPIFDIGRLLLYANQNYYEIEECQSQLKFQLSIGNFITYSLDNDKLDSILNSESKEDEIDSVEKIYGTTGSDDSEVGYYFWKGLYSLCEKCETNYEVEIYSTPHLYQFFTVENSKNLLVFPDNFGFIPFRYVGSKYEIGKDVEFSGPNDFGSYKIQSIGDSRVIIGYSSYRFKDGDFYKELLFHFSTGKWIDNFDDLVRSNLN